jgi:hypothetical protein
MINIDTKLAILVMFMGLESGSTEGVLQLVQTHVVPDAALHACDNVYLHLTELDVGSQAGAP